MPVRLRITLLFCLLVFLILTVLCTSIYYFSFEARQRTIKTRLSNRALTTAKLLSQKEIFDQKLVQQIDSLTTITLKNITVQSYDGANALIYFYSDVPGETLPVDSQILANARQRGRYYFRIGAKEAVASLYGTEPGGMVTVTAAEDEEGRDNLKNLKNILVISFIVGNMVVLVIGYFFSGRLLLPIKQISEDVAEISAQNLARRIHTGHIKDEWYRLSATLNELLNRLQESFDLQRRFISNASHELSTPLTSISSQLEVALQRSRSPEEYRKMMESIYQDVQHMGKLTQTLLEFAKASGNSGGLEINLVRLDEILLGLPAEIARLDPAYTVSLAFENMPEEEEQLLVFGNETLLKSAIRNLVLNACKYSPDHRAVLGLSAAKNWLYVTVSDQGPGIPGTEIEKIFQPFYRVEENRGGQGFGLGLSLAERIIRIHKGTISVDSRPGEGSLFTLKLPSARFQQF